MFFLMTICYTVSESFAIFIHSERKKCQFISIHHHPTLQTVWSPHLVRSSHRESHRVILTSFDPGQPWRGHAWKSWLSSWMRWRERERERRRLYLRIKSMYQHNIYHVYVFHICIFCICCICYESLVVSTYHYWKSPNGHRQPSCDLTPRPWQIQLGCMHKGCSAHGATLSMVLRSLLEPKHHWIKNQTIRIKEQGLYHIPKPETLLFGGVANIWN